MAGVVEKAQNFNNASQVRLLQQVHESDNALSVCHALEGCQRGVCMENGLQHDPLGVPARWNGGLQSAAEGISRLQQTVDVSLFCRLGEFLGVLSGNPAVALMALWMTRFKSWQKQLC